MSLDLDPVWVTLLWDFPVMIIIAGVALWLYSRTAVAPVMISLVCLVFAGQKIGIANMKMDEAYLLAGIADLLLAQARILLAIAAIFIAAAIVTAIALWFKRWRKSVAR